MQRRQREGASWKQRGESFGISVNGLNGGSKRQTSRARGVVNLCQKKKTMRRDAYLPDNGVQGQDGGNKRAMTPGKGNRDLGASSREVQWSTWTGGE